MLAEAEPTSEGETTETAEIEEPSGEPSAGPQLSKDTFSFAPEQLNVDPQRFQFRSAANAEGTEGRLKGVEKWNPDAAGRLMVWEDKAGKHWVVDGHHRLELAKKLKAENPTEDIRLNASILREADGVTAEDAWTAARDAEHY